MPRHREAATLLLTRAEVARLLSPRACRLALEDAFRAQVEGAVVPPGVLSLHLPAGGLHVKAAGLHGSSRTYVAAKCNANIPSNPSARGLPTIQGIVALFDGDTGFPLALLDSIELTLLRTAAATAVAAKHLARRDARVAALVGCGAQAAAQLRALLDVLPLERIRVHDLDESRASRFAESTTRGLDVDAALATSIREATLDADVVVTCTTARRPFLDVKDVSAGAFVAAVGADHPEKSEIAPALMARSAVVVDVLSQCETMGDLHHAIAAGTTTTDDVRAELFEVSTGRKRGRLSADEIVVFDSTGSALTDVAAAAVVYEAAREAGAGTSIDLAGGPW